MPGYMRLDVDFNPSEIKRLYKHIEHLATHLKPVFRKAKEELKETYTNHFLTNGGGTWAPLDAEYGTWKASRFPGAPTLIRTGKLFEQVSKLESENINDMSATFGVDSEIAKFHQYGTWSMPKREIIFVPAGFAVRFSEHIADHIEDGLHGWM